MKISNRLAVLALALCILPGCSKGDSKLKADGSPVKSILGKFARGEKVNPLAEKEYTPLTIDVNDDFETVFSDLCQKYSSHVSFLGDYLEGHEEEITSGRGFSDLDDFEILFDEYYGFLYAVTHCDDKNIPEEYKDAWAGLKRIAQKNKDELDKLYSLKGDKLSSSLSDMLLDIVDETNALAKIVPAKQGKKLSIGDTISSDFVEITLGPV